MKKIFILSLILALLVERYGLNFGHEVAAESFLSYPKTVDIYDEETKFVIEIKGKLNSNQRIHLEAPNKGELVFEDKRYEVSIKLSSDYLYNGQTVEVTINHDKIDHRGEYSYKLPIKVKLETYRQEKTIYASQDVESWNYDDYVMEKPSGNYLEVKQYGYQTVESFDENNFLLEAPEDGHYLESIQYGFLKRDKTIMSEVQSIPYERFYNNVGACPIECVPGTANFYGSGCECTIIEHKTESIDVTTYGEWQLDDQSWSYEDSYVESDVLSPTTRTVYLMPKNWSAEIGWRYDKPYEKSETVKPIERTVYVKANNYGSISSWQDEEIKPDKDTIVHTKKVCRILNGNTWSAWGDCA